MVKMVDEMTDEDLQAELKRRQEEKRIDERPKPLADPDFTKLVTFCEDGVVEFSCEGRPPKDFENYVFEIAMKAIFGPDVFKWWNKQYR